jgi:IS5 family transposase
MIAKLLDDRRELIERVAHDLRRGLENPRTGRMGLSPFEVLRAFVLQRIENLDLRSLSERIADGPGCYQLRRNQAQTKALLAAVRLA